MALDPQIEKAIRKSVEDAKQSESLADRLIAWIDAINNGNEDANDESTASRHLELIYEETSWNTKEE